MDFIPPKSGIDLFRRKQKRLFQAVRSYHRTSAGRTVKRALRGWTHGWSTKVNFVQTETIKRGEISLLVFPRGPGRQKWIWVSGGVRTGPKRAKSPRGMAVQQYGPFTLPGPRVGPSTGRVGPVVRAQTVAPTIIKAREFEKDVSKRFTPVYVRAINQLIRSIF